MASSGIGVSAPARANEAPEIPDKVGDWLRGVYRFATDSDSATTSTGDAELWVPSPGRDESKRGLQQLTGHKPDRPLGAGLADSAPTSAVMMSSGNNCTLELLAPGIPSISGAWGLWTLLGAVMLLLLISLAAHLCRWTSGGSRSHPGLGHSGGSLEEVPLYGNLHYLQTGRLSQEPGPDQQDPTPRGPSTAAEEPMCYTSLQLRPSQGRIPSPGTPIKYSEVVLDSEPKPQASGPEPELYASVCAQTRRARASFPDQAYANSQPAPS
ncbi:signaling threshold-regulating transmembrane adapter 1 [Suricata suricatta]|uniref:Signaling threshold regulating transmembrane adaptor 1 n=1 Tax=Suricata suricatta TaxID=37032 RepID=A0A673U885_SURSU|nr:signaling threshold-regulating transmembrane adapter 1 [Suricata suricatta]